MRFLFITNCISAGSGGAQRVATLLCNGLADAGHTVLLILYKERSTEDYSLSEAVRVEILPDESFRRIKVGYYFRKLKLLRGHIKIFQPDVIVPFLSHPMFHTYIASSFTKYKHRILATVRNNPRRDPKEWYLRWRNNIIILLCKACFVQTIKQKNYFPPIIRKKTFVLPNPVSEELLTRAREACDLMRMVTMGRLADQKNHKMLIEAFSIICKKYKDATLDIYGEGALRAELEKLITDKQLSGKVFLRGITNDVKDTLFSHGLFIMTSNYEGMPNALIEAMATGIPCISTDCPSGPSDLITSMENGILIPMDNIKKCAEAIDFMLSHQALACEMGLRGRKEIQKNLASSYIVDQFADNCRKYICNKT